MPRTPDASQGRGRGAPLPLGLRSHRPFDRLGDGLLVHADVSCDNYASETQVSQMERLRANLLINWGCGGVK
jgi:hypothetical protein